MCGVEQRVIGIEDVAEVRVGERRGARRRPAATAAEDRRSPTTTDRRRDVDGDVPRVEAGTADRATDAVEHEPLRLVGNLDRQVRNDVSAAGARRATWPRHFVVNRVISGSNTSVEWAAHQLEEVGFGRQLDERSS
jgi:hypothetical protein